MPLFEIIAICILAGAFAGILSGLLGLGGGLTTVPILSFILPFAGVPQSRAMHVALATSLALMIANTSTAALARYRQGDLDLRLFLRLATPVAVGAFLGVALANQVADLALRLFFIAFVLFAMARTLRHLHRDANRPEASREGGAQSSAPPTLPRDLVMVPYALVTGAVGALAGGGAATLMVPFLGQAGYSMQVAAAQSAGLSATIGLFGAVTYAVAGTTVADMPAGSLGYVYLPALAGLLLGGVVGVPLGVRIAKGTSDRVLRQGFLGFLAIVLVTMLISIGH